jgi:DNA-binding NarL/FixJ family response regulator
MTTRIRSKNLGGKMDGVSVNVSSVGGNLHGPEAGGKNLQTKIRIFVVDDHQVTIGGIRDMVQSTPEKDLVLCQSLPSPTAELPGLIQESGTNVVLMDLKFSGKLTGIAAIRNIRRKIGSKVGIIAFTAHGEYRQDCLDAGADDYRLKEATHDVLRRTIRTCTEHEAITGVEFFLETREILLSARQRHGEPLKRRLSLARNAFALLYYLSEERSRAATDWLIKPTTDQPAEPYRFTEGEFWRQVCDRWCTKADDDKDKLWDNMEIARYVATINKQSANELQLGLRLIIPPGHRPRAGVPSVYALNEFIESSQIVFHGQRVELSLPSVGRT